MRMYELVLVIKDSLTEEKRKKLIESVKSWLKPASSASQRGEPTGGTMKVTREDAWGVKAFAYPIKKERSGYYFVMAFEGATGIATDFEKKILTNENILRHLLVRTK